jgi:PAS domain S-box-containing protein
MRPVAHQEATVVEMLQPVQLQHDLSFLWKPQLRWLDVLSDSFIALTYFLITFALIGIVRKRKDIPFNRAFFCVVGFIIACGITRAMQVVTLWFPIYWVSGPLEVLTAAISIATLVMLGRASPSILAIPDKMADHKFSELIEDAPDAILEVDAKGTIILANQTAETMFGYRREELLGSNVDLLVPVGNRSRHKDHRQGFVHSGTARVMGQGMGDLYARRKDGSEVSVEIGLNPVKTEDGIHTTAVIRDVTERKRTEQQLERTVVQLNSLLESTTVCVLAVDSAWTIHYLNRNAASLLSVDRDIQGMTLWDAFPAQLPEERTILRKVMETRQPAWYESFYPPLDLTTTVQAHPWEDGGVAVFFSDISGQRRLERELEIANRRAESVLENTNVGIFAVDRDWVFRYVNEDAKKLLKARDLLGKDMWKSFPGMTAETTERMRQVMSTRTPAGFDSYYPPLDLSTHLSVNPWEEGGITVCFSDISEQKRMQRELDWERVMREQRLEVLARFSAGIAHEIKNPMAIIHARASDLVELAANGEVLSAAVVTRTCESIVKTSDRVIRILRGLAALAREGANEPMLGASPGEMVEQAIELVQVRYRTNGIQIDSIVPDGLPLVECREVQIGQVLLNLLNNSFDAIEASKTSERWVRVEASRVSSEEGVEQLLIDVVDSGPALSTEVIEHLMEPFYTTKPFGGGIGIGLSVSRAIVTAHGGTLELRDCHGHTCFRLTLPVNAVRVDGVAA